MLQEFRILNKLSVSKSKENTNYGCHNFGIGQTGVESNLKRIQENQMESD